MCSSGGTVAMKSNSRGNTFPSSFTGMSGACRCVVSLTDSWMMSSSRVRLRPSPCPRLCLRTAKANGRSKIMRPLRLLCGTTAKGEIFKCLGRSLRNSAHGMTSAFWRGGGFVIPLLNGRFYRLPCPWVTNIHRNPCFPFMKCLCERMKANTCRWRHESLTLCLSPCEVASGASHWKLLVAEFQIYARFSLDASPIILLEIQISK
jgi:hypothetical protein